MANAPQASSAAGVEIDVAAASGEVVAALLARADEGKGDAARDGDAASPFLSAAAGAAYGSMSTVSNPTAGVPAATLVAAAATLSSASPMPATGGGSPPPAAPAANISFYAADDDGVGDKAEPRGSRAGAAADDDDDDDDVPAGWAASTDISHLQMSNMPQFASLFKVPQQPLQSPPTTAAAAKKNRG